MINIAGHYIFDGKSFLKNAYVSVDEKGTITHISAPGDALYEKSKMLFYSGIIIPGMVNAHCHLELSGYKKSDEKHKGLSYFINSIITKREETLNNNRCEYYDKLMFDNGINCVGDISNTEISIPTKAKSRIKYHSFIELSGLDPKNIQEKLSFAKKLKNKYSEYNLKCSIVPHSFYSVSAELFKSISEIKKNSPISIHFLESQEEIDLFFHKKGNLYDLLNKIFREFNQFIDSSEKLNQYLSLFNHSNVILVHNSFLKNNIIANNLNLYFCVCPKSNLFLHNQIPDKNFVLENTDNIIIGTDSMASNDNLDVFDELKTFANIYQIYNLEKLLPMITSKAAKVLNFTNFGEIKIGNAPGIVLLENVDLQNLKLLNESSVKRII